jgi:hypothetical protein
MPILSKLTKEEIDTLTRRRTPNIDLSEYLRFLDNMNVGDWGSVTLNEGESRRVVKRRLTTAVRSRGWDIRYKPAGENRFYFRLQERNTEPRPRR